MRAVIPVAILGLTLAGWSSGALAQQSSGSDTAITLETAKNSLGQARTHEQKDAVRSPTRGLQVNRRALKAGHSGEIDSLKSLKRAGQDSVSVRSADTLRLEGANKQLSGMAATRTPGQLRAGLDRKIQKENRSSLSARSLKSSLASVSAKGNVALEKDELKKSR